MLQKKKQQKKDEARNSVIGRLNTASAPLTNTVSIATP
jgi:hypothetical protein